MTELNYQELLEINGGSEKTYKAGHSLGKKLRNAVDDLGAVGTVIGIGILILSRGRIRI